MPECRCQGCGGKMWVADTSILYCVNCREKIKRGIPLKR